MAGDMASPASPDTSDLLDEYVSVATVISCVKATITKARPRDRRPMWEAFSSCLDGYIMADERLMPWAADTPQEGRETPQEGRKIITTLPRGTFMPMFRAMITAVDSLEERSRLQDILIHTLNDCEEAGLLSGPNAGTAPASSSGARCQVCSGHLPPGSKRSRRTCSDKCRKRLSMMNQRRAQARD
jgi:hypothetical protein